MNQLKIGMKNNNSIVFREVRFFYFSEENWSINVHDLSIDPNCVTCIVGQNGSGKSTLLRLAAGILHPIHGSVEFNGVALERLQRRELARHIAFLPQEVQPLFDYTVETVIEMGRYIHTGWTGALTEIDRRAVKQALEAVDLSTLRKRPFSRLSGGERRRALIASVLAQESTMLLLDEPTASLDIHHATAVMRLLASSGSNGKGVVIVTHDINLASLFADRIILLINGHIAADGSPADVIREDYIRQAYGDDVIVRKHPETGGPLVLARRTNAIKS